MTDQQIISMNERLSFRLNSPDHRQDMLQEGLLVCYEILAGEPDAHPAKLYRASRVRMHSYLNIDILPVSVPQSRDVREILWENNEYKGGNGTQKNKEWLTNILRAPSTEFDEAFFSSDLDQAKDYEEQEYAEYLYCLALSMLTRKEFHVIKLRYYEGLTQTEIHEGLGISRQGVAKLEIKALEKLKKIIE